MPTDKVIFNVSDLTEIKELVSECRRCPLCQTKTKDVVGVGLEKARIMFIGEAPGKAEDLSGEPFVGSAGKFLNEMLQEINCQREDVYITNVLKHRPPDNRDPKSEEITACWPYLVRQIEIINPALIVFLGRHSLNRFFPSFKISEVHGKAFKKDFNNISRVFLALYHPAAALYNGGMRETLKEDFAKIPAIINKIEEKNNIKDKTKNYEQKDLFDAQNF